MTTASSSANYGKDTVAATTPHRRTNVTLDLRKLRLLSHGMFSNVYAGELVVRAFNSTDTTSRSGLPVAIKKTWSKAHLLPNEITILCRINRHRHKNIVQLLYVFHKQHKEVFCHSLVFEYLSATLHYHIRQVMRPLLKQNQEKFLLEVKLMTWQLFRGQAHLDQQRIIHRDIKPHNILLNPDSGILKIGDFGSSKIYHEGDRATSYHVTRYYRAPELLLGSNYYSPAIDVWSCGCVFGELLTTRVLFPGESTMNQLEQIVETFGMPTFDDMQLMNASEDASLTSIEAAAARAPSDPLPKLAKKAPIPIPEGIKLMRDVLIYSPNRRLSGPNFLKSTFFSSLFDNSKRIRYNGHALSEALTSRDLETALAGDLKPFCEASDNSKTGSAEVTDTKGTQTQ